MNARVQSWREAGELVEVLGRRLYVQERDGDGTLLVFLHGFPSSSYDWRELADLLPGKRMLLFDFLGFGLSDKPADHLYTLAWQADAMEELVRRAVSPPVFLVAHDMGTSVATELMARDLRGELGIDVRGALLFNGSILLERASPTIGQKLLRSRVGPVFARLSNQRSFRAQFSKIFSPGHPLGAEEAADQWELIAHNDGQRIMHLTINYMSERERFIDRWHGAFRDWQGSLSLAWGLKDPVATTAVLDGLRSLRPSMPVRELQDLGHYPQLEEPHAIASALADAIARAPD